MILRALVLAALLAATAAAPASAKQRWLFVNGDSLAVGTEPYMPEALPGWRFRTSAAISRHAYEGDDILRSRPRLARHVAVSLGTNDDPRQTGAFRDAIEDVMDVVGERRCVVWANIVRPPVAGASYAGYNRVLREARDDHPNLRIVDWKRLTDSHPEWLAGDGVHVSAAGYRGRALAYGRAVKRCAR